MTKVRKNNSFGMLKKITENMLFLPLQPLNVHSPST